MNFRAAYLGVLVIAAMPFVAGCGKDQAHETAPNMAASPQTTSTAGTFAPPIDAADAITMLKAEKWVQTAHYLPGKFPNWIIEVKGSGSPEFGYADIACMIIREGNAEEASTVVQMVEAGSYIEGEAPSLSLGMVDCKTGAQAS